MDTLADFLDQTGFMPHGMCYLWRPDILALHVASDALIAVSYFVIPVFLWMIAAKRDDLVPVWSLHLFSAFILLCGITHVVSIWVIWEANYILEGLFKLTTGLVSAATALMVWMARHAILGLPNRNTLDDQVRERTAELQAVNQDLEDFAHIASHDLREPLRGIRNNALFLLEDYRQVLDDDGIQKLERMSHLTERLESLITDLMFYSRLGRHELALQPTDLNVVMGDVEATLLESLEEAGATLAVEPLPTVNCDPVRVTELFRNLVGNAVRYNDKPDKRVEVGAVAGSEGVLYVRDNGVGIAPEFHSEVFRMFRRLHSVDQFGTGSGVGLAFVHKIVERHGGRIWLESEPGQGTTFFFTLAAARPALVAR